MKTLCSKDDTGFCLNNFNNDTSRTPCDLRQLPEIIILQHPHIGQKRAKRPLPVLTAHDTHRALGMSVVSISEGYDLRPTREALGQFHGPFYGFTARIDEINRV